MSQPSGGPEVGQVAPDFTIVVINADAAGTWGGGQHARGRLDALLGCPGKHGRQG
mgnify:CR=1 FL=1